MAYEKRVCVLKQIKKGFTADGSALTGAVYAERLGTELTVTPKLAGIAPLSGGRYCFAVWADGQIFCLEYGNAVKMQNAPTLRRGFAALLCYVREEAEPIAYGCCGDAPRDVVALISAISPAGGKMQTNPKKIETAEAAEKEDGFLGEGKSGEQKYDDEAIATADYFAFSESGEDAGSETGGEDETKTAAGGHNAGENELPPMPPSRGSLVYFHEVKDRLNEAFTKYPRDDRLKAIFPVSEWVNFNGSLLGIVYEEGTPRYLCVAVEAKGEPPEEVKDRGCFVPRTQFSDEEGFYVVFQDADTGEYVRVYDA